MEEKRERSVDWLGAFLITASLVLITFCLGEGPIAKQGWGAPYIIALLVVGVVLLFAFLGWQYFLEHLDDSKGSVSEAEAVEGKWWKRLLRRENLPPPLMKLSIWKRAKGRFAVMQTIAFLEWASFLSWSFWAQACHFLLFSFA